MEQLDGLVARMHVNAIDLELKNDSKNIPEMRLLNLKFKPYVSQNFWQPQLHFRPRIQVKLNFQKFLEQQLNSLMPIQINNRPN